MPATYRKDTTTFDLPGFQFRPLAVPSTGSTELAIWQLDVAPNAASDLHSMNKEEVFVVTAGRLLFEVAGAQHELQAGDAMTVLPGQELKVSNPHEESAKALACTSKGMQAMIDGAAFTPPWMI